MQRFIFKSYLSIFLIFLIYIPISAYLFFCGLKNYSFMLSFIFFILGALLWSLSEYLIHQFIFHGHFKHKAIQRLQYYMHLYHHDYPLDASRYVVPLLVTMPFVIFLFSISFLFVFPKTLLAGFIFGYVLYDGIHYAIHATHPKSKWGKFLKQHHFSHHFKNWQRAFGVSSPLWDEVFHTMPDDKNKIQTTKQI